MFHRRRAQSNPPNRGASTVSPAAALAASQAFLKDRAAHVALSSAAAAAAIRAHPTTPTQVGDVQTKRMVRKNSLSSTASSAAGRSTSPMGAGTLRRQNSSGSMTERTFRAPSPSRGISMGDAHGDIPPVPAVPKDLVSQQHRRTTSLQPPQRIKSPDDGARPGGRGRSLERGLESSIHSPRGARATSMPHVPEAERSDPRRSAVNFSYPISPQGSPRASPVQKRPHGGWFTAPLTSDVQPRKDLPSLRPKPAENLQYQLRETSFHLRDNADQVIPKDRKRASLPPQGTYLASGGMGGKPRGTAVKERDDVMAEKERTVPPPQQLPTPPESEDTPERIQDDVPQAATKEIGVAAEPEGEEIAELEDDEDSIQEVVEPEIPEEPRKASPDVVPVQQPSVERGHTRTASQPVNKMEPQTLAVPPEVAESREDPKEPQRIDKLAAVHPARTAHFAPVAIEPNGVRHQPPPRSLSPAKSALKRASTSPARNTSPNAVLTHGPSRLSISEASDTMSDDGIRSGRKKNVRVSFEEPAIAAYPSPTNSSNPESPISGAPRGLTTSKWSTAPEADLQDVMKPRPALPSFGSIRGRRRSHEDVVVEEPPQKVTETVSSSLSNSVSTIGEHPLQHSQSPQQSPSPPLETSSDHAIGGILAQDFAKKTSHRGDEDEALQPTTRDKENDKVARHDAWDPLPPEVTSVEGSGYFSDSDDNSTEATETVASGSGQVEVVVARPPTPPVGMKSEKEMEVRVEEVPKVPDVPEVEQQAEKAESKATVHVPEIAVQPASPAPEQEEEDYFIVPGGFPEEMESARPVRVEEPKKVVAVLPEPVKTTKQPDPVPSSVAQQIREERERKDMPLSTVEEESSDDGSSIYSDAAEEFSDDDQEFGSIDAVVESKVQPVQPSPPRISTPPRAPTLDTIPETRAVPPTEVSEVPVSRTEEGPDWDKVQAYWNGVSEKQKQLEVAPPVQQPKAPSATSSSSIGTKSLKQNKKTMIAQPGPVVRQAPITQEPKPQQLSVQKARQPAAEKPRQSKIPSMKQSMRTQPVEPAPPATHLRQSMRSQPAEPASPTTHIRQSMREQQPTLRTSMRGSGGGLAASRYSDDMTAHREHHAALQKRHGAPQPIATTTPRPRTAPGLSASMHNPSNISRIGKPLQSPLLPGEDDSDASESSFKRSRKPKAGFGGGERYSMRRTMRGSSGPTIPPPTRQSTSPSRFNLRSLSPPGVSMRRSMRTGSLDAKAPTSRTSFIPGLGKDKSKSKTLGSPAGKTKPRFISRFADSSDEEDTVRPTFRSRFADSDDEDDVVMPVPLHAPTYMPAGLTPVRGIPRKPGDSDAESTDLEGENSDEEAMSPLPKSKDIGKHSTTSRIPISPTASHTGTLSKRGAGLLGSKHAPAFSEPSNTLQPAQQQPATPEKEKSKRRFFGFGKRRFSAGPGSLAPLQRPSTPPPATAGAATAAAATSTTAPQSQSAQAAAMPASPASPTLGPETGSTGTAFAGAVGKLQRRAKPPRVMSDSWPLPPKMLDPAEGRPQSHDGVPGAAGTAAPQQVGGSPLGKGVGVVGRPMMRGRVFSNDTIETNGTSSTVGPYGADGAARVISARTGKKKKFSTLRKVFRLDD